MEMLKVKIWGTRGSMPAPYPDRMIYGGNTSCISLEWNGEMVVFDCGSGIKALGMELENNDSISKKVIHIFISHLHLDHIIGLPFLPQIYHENWTIHFYGISDNKGSFQETLCQVLSPPFWPVSLEKAGAKLFWHELDSINCISLPNNAMVYIQKANHPDPTVMFRFEKDDIRIAYALDYEITDSVFEEYTEFVKDCNLLIFDGMYTDVELEKYRGFGHSSWEQGLRIQKACGIKHLSISHHEWGRKDSEILKFDQMVKEKTDCCCFAQEGMEFDFRT